MKPVNWRAGLKAVQPTSTEGAEEAGNPAEEGSACERRQWKTGRTVKGTPCQGLHGGCQGCPLPAVTVTKELQCTKSWTGNPQPGAVSRVRCPCTLQWSSWVLSSLPMARRRQGQRCRAGAPKSQVGAAAAVAADCARREGKCSKWSRQRTHQEAVAGGKVSSKQYSGSAEVGGNFPTCT